MNGFPRLCEERRGPWIALLVGLALGAAIGAGAVAFATRDVFAAISGAGTAVPIGALLIVAGAGLAIAAVRIIERSVAEHIGQSFSASLRRRLFAHLARVSAQDLSRRRSGALAMRFVGDLAAVRSWVSLGIANLISALIVLPGALAVLIAINPSLAAAAIGPLGVSLVLMALIGPRLGPLHRQLRNRRARIAADMAERVPVAPELRLLGRERRELNRLADKTAALRLAAIARARASALMRAIPEAGAALAAGLLLWTAHSVGATPAEAAASLAIMGIVVLPLRDLAGVWDRHRAWQVARDKCQAILATPVLETGEEKSAAGIRSAATIEFQSVESKVLRSFTARAPAGAKIAIVGPNGAGKSTLLTLAAGLEQANGGRVLLDGKDMRFLSPGSRAKTTAFIGQHSPILRGSLRRALTLGIPRRPPDNVIEAAARELGLARLLQRLGGLDGQIAEAGKNLSSGESRRVHLVRVHLSQPRLLLLDEPEKALDATGRRLVVSLTARTEATTLVVTHDLELARCVDTVWYVGDGQILEAGSPDHLLEADGLVARHFRGCRAA